MGDNTKLRCFSETNVSGIWLDESHDLGLILIDFLYTRLSFYSYGEAERQVWPKDCCNSLWLLLRLGLFTDVSD